MNQTLTWLAAVDWLEVLRSLAPVATAGIAFAALRNWRRQDKAKRQAEFLDELIEATHTFVIEVHKPIEMMRMSKIGMASHIQNWGEGSEEDKAVAGAIAYIEKRGEDHGKRLAAMLNEAEPSMVRLRTLSAKGQVFGFPNYKKCQDAVTLMTWHLERIVSYLSIIQSPTWNWDHPEVRDLLVKVMAIDPDEMRISIAKNNAALLEFAQETYRGIYG